MLDQIHKISEIVGAVALVASLIFVGVQINQNTESTRASNAQAALNSWSEQGLSVATNERLNRQLTGQLYPELAQMFDLNEETMSINQWTILALRAVETNYIQWRKGNLSDEIWAGYRQGMFQNFLSFRNFNERWDQDKAFKTPDMRAYFDDLQARAKALREYVIEHGGPPPSLEPYLPE